MATSDMDYLLEDTTGRVTDTDFCDINDRRFLRVRKTLVRADYIAVQVFDLGTVKPAAFSTDYHEFSRAVLVLQNSGSSLGTVKYEGWESAMSAENYLRKPLLSRSSSRTFRMSDGQEYKWARGTVPEQEWVCLNSQRYLVAHYDVKLGAEAEYRSSAGNTLTICQSFTHLTVEIITSLILMRHIAQTA